MVKALPKKKKVIKKNKTKTIPKSKLKKAPVKKVKKTSQKKTLKKTLNSKLKLKLNSKSKLKLKVKAKAKEKEIKRTSHGVKLERALRNPIIQPRMYSWESKATFNPTAFESNGKIHLIYRAIGEDDVSVLGYASSYDGYHIEERPTHFIYKRYSGVYHYGKPITYDSGGGWSGGCEDPRITLIDDTLYLLYTAFDGWSSVRIALTSIKLDDFKKKRWNMWERPVLISPPGQINKNWVIFPEKINGKFAILHSFYPKIMIDYFDSLDEFDGKKFIRSNNTRPVDTSRTWDSWFRGVGPSPIKIKEGWLVLYHAMDHKNPDRYRMGALILDAKDPTKVLYRSVGPILEPETHYENHGHKWGVVYSCGAVVKNDRLFVYYGGADTVVCVASIKLKNLVESLEKHIPVHLKKMKLVKEK